MPDTLARLHADYSTFDRLPPSQLNADQHTSLRYYRAEHQHRNGGESSGRIGRWITDVLDLEAFIAEHRRMPRENNRLPASLIPARERHLADWVRTQRRAIATGRRCTYQLRRLALVPGFATAPIDEQWHGRLNDYAQFLAQTKGAPRSNSNDRHEQSLAAWAAKQRLRHRRRQLAAGRVAHLEALTIWTWGRGSS